RFEVERLASEEHLAASLAIRDPPATPPVTELHEPAALHSGAEDDDGVGDLGMVVLDVPPRLLARSHDRATARLVQPGIDRGQVLVRDCESGEIVPLWDGQPVKELYFDELPVGLDPLPHDIGRQPEVWSRDAGYDVVAEPQVYRRGWFLADLHAKDGERELRRARAG